MFTNIRVVWFCQLKQIVFYSIYCVASDVEYDSLALSKYYPYEP
jgi:hypothetical protein